MDVVVLRALRRGFVVGVLICLALSCPAGALNLEFVADSPEHQAAVAEYQEVWREDGVRIVEVLSEATGVFLSEDSIRVVVREGVSRSGIEGQPMYLRASYPMPTKRATLVHELAHRYLAKLDSDSEYSDVHFPLSLLLYRVWNDLWGEDFALSQAKVEAGRSTRYRRAWNWVLSMSKAERNMRWKEYLEGPKAQLNHPALN